MALTEGTSIFRRKEGKPLRNGGVEGGTGKRGRDTHTHMNERYERLCTRRLEGRRSSLVVEPDNIGVLSGFNDK